VRRGSFEDEDLFYAHIAGMDAFARGLKAAAKIIETGLLDNVIEHRYRSWREGIGAEIRAGKHDLKSLEAYALKLDTIRNESHHLERLRAQLNEIIFSV